MAFTTDELQSLNDIFDRKLSAHRREMERVFDQRIQLLRRDIEQRFITTQREITQILAQKLVEQQKGLQATVTQKLTSQQLNFTQAFSNELRQRQQQSLPLFEGLVDRALAAQLLAIEELLNQHNHHPLDDGSQSLSVDEPPHFEAIEVQTELPWEDLVDIFGKALDERFAVLNEAMQTTMRRWEQYLSLQLQTLQKQMRDEMLHNRQLRTHTGNLTNMQEVFQSIEQLERIIESMQVAMTANHALLSNRLYHHQQLPLERAHASEHTNVSLPNGTGTPRSLTGERGGQ